MSAISQAIVDAAPSRSRVRLVPLADLLGQANDAHALEKWLFQQASQGLCRLYWPIPWNRCAFSGPFDKDIPLDRGLERWPTRDETNPDCWKERPEVKYVRIAAKFSERISARFRAYVLLFRDGLFVPSDVTADSGLLEPTTFKARIRVSMHTQPAPRTSTLGCDQAPPYLEDTDDATLVTRDNIYVEEGMWEQARAYLKQPSSLSATALAHIEAIQIEHPSTATAAAIRVQHADGPATGECMDTVAAASYVTDPFKLRGRADGLYVLYLTAQRCAANPAYRNATKPEERKKFAKQAFDQVLAGIADDSVSKLQVGMHKLYGKTRLNYALRLIDPAYDHNRGRPKGQWLDWPPGPGRALVDQPDERRQDFVTDMLRLLIGGAEQWLRYKEVPPVGHSTKSKALKHWLIEHGITGSGEVKTAFAVITWNGHRPQPLPGSATR